MTRLRNGSPALSRDLNRTAILSLIAEDGPIARAEIARQLALSPATVTDVTRDLVEAGVVRVVDQVPSSGGRPALLLGLVGEAAHALGAKIAADHIAVVRVTLDGEVIQRLERPFDAFGPEPVERLAESLSEIIASADTDSPPLLGVGLGVPGSVDPSRDGTVDAPAIGWRGLPLGKELRRRFGLPVLVDNDVNTLAVAERLYGRGRGVDHFVTVTIGRGVGLGIVVEGDLYRGAQGGAGEFGHVSFSEDGPRCYCGKHGCLEAVVAEPALVREASEAGLFAAAGLAPSPDALRSLADDGDPGALPIYGRAGSTLGRAVAGLVNVLNPQLILLSGEGIHAWPHMAATFSAALEENTFSPLRGTRVEIDPWDDAKWARGAAALVLRATFAAPLYEHGLEDAVRARLNANARATPIREQVAGHAPVVAATGMAGTL